MATITDFRCVDEKILSDAFGNNVAVACPSCGHPVLVIVREKQRGAEAANPAICRRCRAQIWVSVDPLRRQLQLHVVPSP